MRASQYERGGLIDQRADLGSPLMIHCQRTVIRLLGECNTRQTERRAGGPSHVVGGVADSMAASSSGAP